MPLWIWLCPYPTGPSDAHGMTQLLPSCPQPALIATLLPLRRVSHCPVGAAVSAKHLRELKQASTLKSGSISKQQKGSIFPIWFTPLRHSESQPVVLGTELHPDWCASVSARRCCASAATAGGGHSSSACPTAAGTVAQDAAITALAAELKEVHWDGILFSCCCFRPSPPLLLFFRLFFQLFQPCCFTASLFNPLIIRGPVTPTQDASRSLSSTKRAT